MKTYTINTATHKVVALDSDTEMTTAFARVFNVNRQRESFNPAYRAMIAAAPEYPADAGWISVDERLPSIGQTVDLCINGVVQRETYELDCGDTSDYAPLEYFWSRDCIADYPDVKSGQYWRARPLPPAPEDSQK